MHTPNFEADILLVKQARESDPDAMREIVERHQDHIYRLAYRLIGDIDKAQDVVQDTFLKAFQNLDAVQNGRALNQWLRQIATNLIRDRWKTQKDTCMFDETHPDARQSTTTPLHNTQERETEAHIQSALMTLSPDYREAFVLKHVEELDYKTLSTTLNITVSAAKVRVHRACQMLREQLSQYCPNKG